MVERTADPRGTNRLDHSPNIVCPLRSRIARRRPRLPMRHRHTGIATLRHWHCLPTGCPSLPDRMPARETGFMGARRRRHTQFTQQLPSFDSRGGGTSNRSPCFPFPTSSQRARAPSQRTRMTPARPFSRRPPRHRTDPSPTLLGVANSPQPSQGRHQGTV